MNQQSLAPVILFFSLGIILLGACNKRTAAPEATSISVLINAMPKGLHPIGGRDVQRRDILYYTHQCLIRTNPVTRNREPLLLAQLPELSEDGLLYTYDIHPNAKWQDGTAITAKDVAFSIKAAACEFVKMQASAVFLARIEKMIFYPESPRRIGLKMKKVNVLNAYLTDAVNIIDRRVFDPQNLLEPFLLSEMTAYLEGSYTGSPDSTLTQWAEFVNESHFSRDPLSMRGGSGPYQLVEWIPGQRIILEKIPSYWGKDLASPLHRQASEKIVYKFISDGNTLELELKQQKLDVVPRISTTLSDRLKDNKTIQNSYVRTYETSTDYAYIAFNLNPDGMTHKPIFSELAVRKAFASLAPIDEMIPDFYGGKAVQVVSPISRYSPAYNSNLKLPVYDLQKAKAILEKSGWKDTDGDFILDKIINGKRVALSIELTYPIGPKSAADIAIRLAAEGKKIGFEIKPQAVNFGLMLKRLPNRDFDAVMLATTPGYPYDFYRDWATDGRANFSGFSNPEADSLIAIIPTTLDDELRFRYMRRVQTLINEEQPVLFFFNAPHNMLASKRLNFKNANPLRPFILLNTLSAK